MSYLDQYNLTLDKKNNSPYISLAEYGITFPSEALECLHHAEYVHVFYDDQNKVVAFQPCDKDDNAYALCGNIVSRNSKFVRWSGHRHRDHIARLINVELTKKSIRLDGKYLAEEDILLFELGSYVEK